MIKHADHLVWMAVFCFSLHNQLLELLASDGEERPHLINQIDFRDLLSYEMFYNKLLLPRNLSNVTDVMLYVK